MILALVLVAPAAIAQTRTKPAVRALPVYAPVKDEVEIKQVRRGTKARFEFTIRNTGKAPLQIAVKPNCSCTVPNYDRVIAPGASGKVVAELDTLDLSGYVTKTLLVTTNDPKHPRAGLYMIVTVSSMVTVEPSDRVVMRLPDTGPMVQELTLKMQEGETARITGARSNNRLVQARLEPVEEGQEAKGEGQEARTYRLTLTAIAETPPGRHQARITLPTTSPVEPEIRIHVTCEKGIVATPVSLYLGALPVKLKEPIERSIILVRHGGRFAVKAVTCDDPAVRVAYTTVRAGEYYKVSVRYAGGWPTGWVQRRIVVETDDSRQPQIIVPLTARVGDQP
jgi:hypothetical protein